MTAREAMVARLDARFTFVVGKGGTGKTTSAGALALALADGGESVHLLSTDPAHSLGDLFEQDLTLGAITASGCADRLLLEELDAQGRARDWLDSVRASIAELVDAGTYLDSDDVAALLERALPGMDEVMAALRVVELADAPLDRVVVDTAPTGHTLRLLDSADVLDGWSEALSAMADKAGAVAVGLTGRRIRFAGEAVIEELRAAVVRFRDGILPEAAFVIVTRGGDVVSAETRRLDEALTARGCRVRAVLDVGGCADVDASTPVFTIPWLHAPAGCAGLRGWGTSEPGRAPVAGPGRGTDAAADAGPSAVERLRGRELYLFAGKGGVGKSTCAAAFALALGRHEDVLLLGTDPAGSLADVLGAAIGPEGTRVTDRVLVRELDAPAELVGFRARYREEIHDLFGRMGVGRNMPADRRVLETIVEMAPPGVDEIFALDTILDDVGERRTVVVDTAPTGHLLRLLEMPELARDWARGAMRFLLRYRSVLGLDDFADRVLRFAKRLDRLIGLLRDPARAGAVVVSLDGSLVGHETGRLLASLERRGVPVAGIVGNRGQGRSDLPGGPPWIEAPDRHPAPIGPAALLDFADAWRWA